MCVAVDHDRDPGRGRRTRVDVVEVATVGRGVDLEHLAAGDGRLDHPLEIELVRSTPFDFPSREVADDVDVRVLDRVHDPVGHRRRVHRERRVDRRHDPVELGQQLVLVVERPVGEDVDLRAGEQLDPADGVTLRQLVDPLDLFMEPVWRDLVAETETRRVVGDREIGVTGIARGERHLLDRRGPVRGCRVTVQVPLQIGALDQVGQRTVGGGLELAAVLAQLGLDVLQAEQLVDLVFALATVRLAGRVVEHSIFRHVQPPPHGAVAQRHVVLLGTREVLHQVAELIGRDDPQVDLQPRMGPQSHAGLAGSLRRFHQLERGRGLSERERVPGGRDHVEILDAVGHPPCRACELDALGRRMLAQRGDQLLADVQRLVEHDPPGSAAVAGAVGALGQRSGRGGEDALLGLRAKALELADLLSLGRRRQRLQRVDRKLLVQTACALGPESLEPRDLEEPGRELGPQLRRRRDHAVVRECDHLLLDDRADSGELRGAPLSRERGHRYRRVANRLGRIPVGDDPMDDRPVELRQVRKLVQRGGDFAVRRLGHYLCKASSTGTLYFLKWPTRRTRCLVR